MPRSAARQPPAEAPQLPSRYTRYEAVTGPAGSSLVEVTQDTGPVAKAVLTPGDANRDGIVDLQDFGLLKAHFGESGPHIGWGQGDFNEDDSVDLQDFGLLKANFGAGDAAVPEPAATLVLLLGTTALLRKRRS